ncbi:MAG: SusC/RagA family TonB-linked outer membrane protein, partial [Bacteroidales bacterium]|nr:SusC/RagA family TonB-linked outer membrane protein [Bacteroidales bacterium]
MKKSIIKTKLSFHRQTLILILLAFSSLLFAQQRTISGTVLDENNESMIGVNIIISGTTTGTITDVDGNYTLTASADDQLVFSYVGYQEQIIPVGDQVRIDISMAPSYSSLDEVVVIGYGTVKRSDLTGSVASVNVDELAKEPVANISQALSGRATGVQVNMASGGPGAEPVVVIRGNNSLNAGNSPLWVVDGFINTNGVTSINPNDIESMEILKDASATAIYGSRGANGVIIVTTKKGTQGKTSFSYIGQFSMQKPSKEFDLMSGHETWEYWHAYDKHFGLDALPPNFWKINPEAIDTTNNADWVNEMVRDPAFMQSHYLSATGGTEKVTYNVSFDYL